METGSACCATPHLLIAATHQNLEERVKSGLFREDLFHRLNVIRIQVPALRERREDIPLLAIPSWDHVVRHQRIPDVHGKIRVEADLNMASFVQPWQGYLYPSPSRDNALRCD